MHEINSNETKFSHIFQAFKCFIIVGDPQNCLHQLNILSVTDRGI